MLLVIISTLICLLGPTVASSAYNANDHTPQLGPADILSLANISQGQDAVRVNASNKLQIQCDGEKYGLNPDLADCQNARSYYKRSKERFTYGERHSGHGADIFPLPFRTMGDAGRCYLEPVLIDSSLGTGTASINHLSDAAYELILECVVRQSKGGIATGIGGTNIGLVLGSYQPDVQCRGKFGTWSSCRSILGDMPVLTRPEIFGPEDDPAVQIILPQYLASSDGKCILRIFGKGSADVTSWFKVWEAASAVYAVCLRHQKVGTCRSLGQLGNIFFTVTDPTPKLQLQNSSSATALSIDEE